MMALLVACPASLANRAGLARLPESANPFPAGLSIIPAMSGVRRRRREVCNIGPRLQAYPIDLTGAGCLRAMRGRTLRSASIICSGVVAP